jgi:hypothetical protein
MNADEESYDCIEEPHPTGLDELVPSTPSMDAPAAVVTIDPNTLADNYEIGFGFYYRYLFRNPERVEFSLARDNYLGIAGISENGDYTKSEKAGDKVLAV